MHQINFEWPYETKKVVHLLIPTYVWDQSWILMFFFVVLTSGDVQSVKAQNDGEEGRKCNNE
eukprot:scaffold11914_cov37-Attheya_sp.AAC.1